MVASRATSAWLVALLAAGPAVADEADGAKLDTSVDLRLRWESWDTPSGNPALESRYDFGNARLRLGADVAWPRVTLHGVLQAAGSLDLPAAGAFGPGPAYVGANDGDTDPDQLGIAELNATFRTRRFRAVLGRQGWMEGAEVLTGVASLDQVKRRRLSERLVGNWDWPNVGRRFDGLTLGVDLDRVHLSGLALRPLAGGIEYRDAFEELDDLTVYGVTTTGKYGTWLPRAEVRLFALRYDDGRPGAVAAAGGDLEIMTWGASFLGGGDRGDLMLWGAVQTGDWGPAEQDAWAFIAEIGHPFAGAPAAPVLRAGIAAASGDRRPGGAHGAFFNLLPTNHKFYGSMDFCALSNLRNLYVEVQLRPAERLAVRAEVHSFALLAERDAWYGGSGAFDEAALGFPARRPAAGRFSSTSLGSEVDLELTWTLGHGLTLAGGAGWFAGGAAAEEVLTADEGGGWGYLQLGWTR